MVDSAIRNVVFDIGNVLVRWAPVEIVRLTFGESGDNHQQARSIFTHPLWAALNRGELTESEAKAAYQETFSFFQPGPLINSFIMSNKRSSNYLVRLPC